MDANGLTPRKNINNWEWTTVGVLLVIVGILSLWAPAVTSLSLAFFVGILLFVTGIIQLVHAFTAINHSGAVSRFVLALLAILAGFLAVRYPLTGMMGLTLMIICYLLVGGIYQMILSRELRGHEVVRHHSSNWMMVSAILSFVLGIYMMMLFPLDSLLIPAIFFGIDLIIMGTTVVTWAITHKNLAGGKAGMRGVA